MSGNPRGDTMSYSRLVMIACLLTTGSVTLASVPIQTVVLSGDPVPGVPSGATFNSFWVPVINNNGIVATTAYLTGTGITSSNDEGIWIGGIGSLELAAREGQSAPNSGGQTFRLFQGPLLGNNGRASFLGILNGSGAGIYASSAGVTQAIAVSGMQAPGLPAGVVFTNGFSSDPDSFIAEPAMNAQGRAAFYCEMQAATGFFVGLWSESSGTLSLVARERGAAPGTPSGVVFSSFGYDWYEGLRPLINDLGQVAFYATLSGPGVTTQSRYGVWSETGGALSLVTRSGSPAPGTPVGVVFTDYSDPRINNAGDTLFKGYLSGPGLTVDNDSGIWLKRSGSELELVMREGSQAPGTAPGVNFSYLFDTRPLMGGPGIVSIDAPLRGTGVDSTNDTGAWLMDGSELELLAREGDQAIGLPDGVLFGDSPRIMDLNAGGLAILASSLTGAGVTSANDQAFWVRDTDGALEPFLREGDQVEIRPGVVKTFRNFEVYTLSGGQDGLERALNDQGEFVFYAHFTDGTQGLFIATVPEPSSMVIALFGALLLRRRIRGRRSHPNESL